MSEPPAAGPPAPPPPPPGWGQPPPPGWGQAPGWGQPPGWGQAPAWTGAPQPGPPGYAAAPDPLGWRPQPGIIPLRPITLGEIFDGAFQAMRSNPRTMLGLSALVLVATTLITLVPTALLTGQVVDRLQQATTGDSISVQDATNQIGGSLAAVIPAALIQWLAVTVLNAVLVLAVSEAVLGRQIGPGALWARVRGRVWAIFGLALLIGLALLTVVLVAVVLGVLLVVATGNTTGGLLIGLVLFPVTVGVCLYAAYRWSLAGPVLLLENQKITTAMRRSWRLVRGSWWRVFGILLLAAIIVSIGRGALVYPFVLLAQIPAGALGGGFAGDVLTLLVQDIGTIIAGTIFYPFSAAVTALLYIDLRMRREGLDVELIRASGA